MKFIYRNQPDFESLIQIKNQLLNGRDIPHSIAEGEWYYIFFSNGDVKGANNGIFNEKVRIFLKERLPQHQHYYIMPVYPQLAMNPSEDVPTIKIFLRESNYSFKSFWNIDFYDGERGYEYNIMPFSLLFFNETTDWFIYHHGEFDVTVIALKNEMDYFFMKEIMHSYHTLDQNDFLENIDIGFLPAIGLDQSVFKELLIDNYFNQ